MSRVHPAENKRQPAAAGSPSFLTVWNKSSMTFHGTDGFTVFDGEGRLVFRVDNYCRRNRWFTGRIVLMDGKGKPLLTFRPKILSLHDRWQAFEGEDSVGLRQRKTIFSLRRRSMVQTTDRVEVFLGSSELNVSVPEFYIDGCFAKRCCTIRHTSGEIAAKISRKQVNTKVLLGNDVFSLIIQPGYDRKLIMAFIVLMDRICQKTIRSRIVPLITGNILLQM